MAAKKLKCVKVQKKNGITWVMLNRPEKRNAMSPQLHFEMDETLRDLETDPATKVVVIAGEGGYFSAGQDLKEFFRANEKNPAGRKAALIDAGDGSKYSAHHGDYHPWFLNFLRARGYDDIFLRDYPLDVRRLDTYIEGIGGSEDGQSTYRSRVLQAIPR